MTLPLAGTSCLVFGCGEIAPDLRRALGGDRGHRLLICVNRAATVHRVAADVTVWIDPGIWESRRAGIRGLCVYDKAIDGPQNANAVPLPMWRSALSRWLNPGRLYHLPNTAVVAALWAMSVGCRMVGLVGCGCRPDGRRAHQIDAMRRVRDKALATYRDLYLIEDLPAWLAWTEEAITLKRIHDDPADRLREFYR